MKSIPTARNLRPGQREAPGWPVLVHIVYSYELVVFYSSIAGTNEPKPIPARSHWKMQAPPLLQPEIAEKQRLNWAGYRAPEERAGEQSRGAGIAQ